MKKDLYDKKKPNNINYKLYIYICTYKPGLSGTACLVRASGLEGGTIGFTVGFVSILGFTFC